MKRIWWIVIGLLLVWMGGCGDHRNESKKKVKRASHSQKVEKPDHVNVFFDRTGSMRGYFLADDKVILRILDQFLSKVNTTFDNLHMTIYSFGFPTTKDTPSKVLMKVGKRDKLITLLSDEERVRDFFRKELTLIEDLIDTIRSRYKSDLNIIMTDMAQKDGNLNGIIESIDRLRKDNKELAVGLVGVEMQFRGPIYNIGYANCSIREFEGYRPFYIMLLGPKEYVRGATEILVRILEETGSKYKMFYVYNPVSNDNARLFIKREARFNLKKADNHNFTIISRKKYPQSICFSIEVSPDKVDSNLYGSGLGDITNHLVFANRLAKIVPSEKDRKCSRYSRRKKYRTITLLKSGIDTLKIMLEPNISKWKEWNTESTTCEYEGVGSKTWGILKFLENLWEDLYGNPPYAMWIFKIKEGR